ncbi:hypothetical protein EXIGLDRAFT_747590 [Exidia glandulosa HHB12029]|uniref:DUF567-domain-containing protein n=1 Tax=Exidia glandulosa HHB12029 TaxID=1314781 RepID=A0A165KMP4_EXIGL|nr:hypothetical protein EXIGLDRAFT_747590 [Exidia glandulosa HHB12029]
MSNTTTPPRPLVGTFPAYAQHQTTLGLRFTGQPSLRISIDYGFHDAATDALVFKVASKNNAIHVRKELQDNSGKPLIVLNKKIISVHTKFEGLEPSSGAHMLTVTSSFGKVTASYVNAMTRQREEIQYTVCSKLGKLLDNVDFTLGDEGRTVASLTRTASTAGRFEYSLTVMPGVDVALMAALCICVDVQSNENHVHGGVEGREVPDVGDGVEDGGGGGEGTRGGLGGVGRSDVS